MGNFSMKLTQIFFSHKESELEEEVLSNFRQIDIDIDIMSELTFMKIYVRILFHPMKATRMNDDFANSCG